MTLTATFMAATFMAQALGASIDASASSSVRQRENSPIRGNTINCGTHFYDDGTAENALFFDGGGHAGEPDHFFGVKFILDDFGLAPDEMVITGFCVGNSFDFSGIGGPWPNEVFFYPDLNGLPDLNRPLRHATMITGDGSGDFIQDFPSPALIRGDFWLLNQGYPPHAGEDFNMETDVNSDPMERSYLTDRGLPFFFQTEQNLIMRAFIEPAPPSQAVPFMGLAAWLSMLSLMSMAAYYRFQTLPQAYGHKPSNQ